MKRQLNTLLTVAVLLFVALAAATEARAQKLWKFEELREIAAKSRSFKIDTDVLIEGFVVSEPTSENREHNTQRFFNTVNDNNKKVVYFESLDGKYGFRCYLASSSKDGAKFPRYARMMLNLNGTTIVSYGGNRFSIENLTSKAIVRQFVGNAAALPRKERYIHELTVADMYTYVTLKDCEFVFKDGSFSNVYENYSQKSAINKFGNNMMDGWASLLCDKYGSKMYMYMNTKVPWRRDGSGVPQGAGDIKGVLVFTWMPRYGVENFFGVAAIRPMVREDIVMSPEPAQSCFKSIAEWNWTNNSFTFNTDKGQRKMVSDEKILADVGTGTVHSMVGGEVIRGRDYNNVRISDGKEFGSKGDRGMVKQGAMRIKTKACNWWNWEKGHGQGIELNFSTEGISGENLMVAFSFGAGEISAITSLHFPVYWGVEYSIDGKHFYRIKHNPITLRSVPWWYVNNVGGATYPTSEEAGLGFTEHMVKLPADAFGRKNVTVRIVPITKNAATLATRNSDKAMLRPSLMTDTYVSFGALAVRYN